MAGCYGNSAEDRHFEGELHKHLEQQEEAEGPDESKEDYDEDRFGGGCDEE